ncbi:GtrA family protein [Cellulomonas hominis]|uniref:GtrA family protein n=1 Tax=Cellulomonas hominis TaxID=156981 RepID=UPI001FF8B203|nr:GtrA family protein [Cellulomonas hominis]
MSEPAPVQVADGRRRLLSFLAVGVASYLVDTGLLLLISGPLGGPLWLATTIGFWTSVVLNFSLNRTVFTGSRSSGRLAVQMVRYGLLLGLNYLVTLGIVTAGVAWGLPAVVPKTFAVGLTFAWNFVAYRWWVFR